MPTSIASLVLLCLAVPAGAQTDARDLLVEARELARGGRYEEAIPRYERLVSAVEQELGVESWTLVFLLHELGSQHHALGQLTEAEPFYRRAVEIGEKHPEEGAASIVPSLRGLAAVSAASAQLAESEAFYRRALEIQEADGVAGPDLARTLAELALLSHRQGRVEQSEALYRRALIVGEAGGLAPLELASIVNNLGALCAGQDRFAEAEPLYRRALAIREGALGLEHPDVAFVLHELASLYHRQDRLAEAAPLYARILEIRELAGSEDPAVSDALSRLAAEPALEPVGEVVEEHPPAAAEPAGTGSRIFRAQVAARRDRQAAERELEELRRQYRDLLAGIPARIVRADLGERGVWHRIQLGEFASSLQGQALCSALSRLGREGCWVIATRPGDS